jgi:hypothetical protein
MNSDFARAMHRATASVRAQNLAEATAIIQAALTRPAPWGDGGGVTAFAGSPHTGPGAQKAELVEGSREVAAPDRHPWHNPPGRLRRPLGEVVRTLREGRKSLGLFDLRSPVTGPAARPPAPDLPEGATFTWRSHLSAAGARQYRLFVPSCPVEELRGLIVMLHGCMECAPGIGQIGGRS